MDMDERFPAGLCLCDWDLCPGLWRPGPPEGREGKKSPEDPSEDFPAGEGDLAACGREEGERLQGYIRAELERCGAYRRLASLSGASARTLSALSSEKRRSARRLAAAYFLVTGVRYWPEEVVKAPAASSWLGALRKSFGEEQQAENSYRAAAEDTQDGCLALLYRELAELCAGEAGVLRSVVERSMG